MQYKHLRGNKFRSLCNADIQEMNLMKNIDIFFLGRIILLNFPHRFFLVGEENKLQNFFQNMEILR